MLSIWANFNHLFEVFQRLFYAFLLWRKDVLGMRLVFVIKASSKRFQYSTFLYPLKGHLIEKFLFDVSHAFLG